MWQCTQNPPSALHRGEDVGSARLEPLIWHLLPRIVHAKPSVPHVGPRLGHPLFVVPLESKIDDVGDARFVKFPELGDGDFWAKTSRSPPTQMLRVTLLTLADLMAGCSVIVDSHTSSLSL